MSLSISKAVIGSANAGAEEDDDDEAAKSSSDDAATVNVLFESFPLALASPPFPSSCCDDTKFAIGVDVSGGIVKSVGTTTWAPFQIS